MAASENCDTVADQVGVQVDQDDVEAKVSLLVENLGEGVGQNERVLVGAASEDFFEVLNRWLRFPASFLIIPK